MLLISMLFLPAALCEAPAEEEAIQDYVSDTLNIHAEHVWYKDTSFVVAYVQIASADQFMTALAGNPNKGAKATVTEMAQKNDAVVAMNGDFFTFRKKGYEVRNYIMFRKKPDPQLDLLIVDENGDFTVIVKSNAEDLEAFLASGHQVRHAFTFGPELVRDGEELTISDDYAFSPDDYTDPRSAIGQIGPLSYALVTAEGRLGEYSYGATQQKMAAFMKKIGCVSAFGLDGGFTAALYYNGELINHQKDDMERKISDIIYFVEGE